MIPPDRERVEACPHCGVVSQFETSTYRFAKGKDLTFGRVVGGPIPDTLLLVHTCRNCRALVIDVAGRQPQHTGEDSEWPTERIYPWKPRPPALSTDVPDDLRAAFVEAWSLRNVSEKAAAVLARRCLQLTLRKQGYRKGTLDLEIDAAREVVSPDLATRLHYVRTVGNIGAHPMDAEGGVDFNQLLDVQPGELTALFSAIREAFAEFYVRPAQQKRELDDLNAKLKAAGKSPLVPKS